METYYDKIINSVPPEHRNGLEMYRHTEYSTEGFEGDPVAYHLNRAASLLKALAGIYTGETGADAYLILLARIHLHTFRADELLKGGI